MGQANAGTEFLLEAGLELNASLDQETIATALARLIVPRLADWCVVDLESPDGRIRRVAVQHADPERAPQALELQRRYPPDPAQNYGPSSVLRSGETVCFPALTRDQVAHCARDQRHLELIQQLGLRSYLCLPLAAQEQRLGALTLLRGPDSREFSPADVQLGEALAVRAGQALNNARLYGELLAAEQRQRDAINLVAHELRSPLTALTIAGQLIQSRPERRVRLAETVEQQAHRLERLVNDLADLALTESGQIRLWRERLDLVELARQVLEQPQFASERQRIRLDALAGPDVGRWDGDRLAQVLQNLLSNAIKYSPNGGEIVLSVEPRAEIVRVAVRDRGMGIPAEALPSLFERYYRAEAAARRDPRGLGLGLNIARTLVEAHGGRIWAESTLGQGSTFFVELPRDAPPARPSP